jgi:hypothetical protein
MAHPARAEAARTLQKALPELAPEIIFDPQPDGPPTTLRTARLAWRATDPQATHHLVLTDDVLPSPAFARQLGEAVAARPHDPLSFFCMWSTRNSFAFRLAALHGATWVQNVSSYVPCQALAVPVGLAGEIADFLEHEAVIGKGSVSYHDNEDDMSVHKCLRRLGVQALLSVPSLVDHPRRASLLGHPAEQPTVALMGDDDPPPDWFAPPYRPGCVPHVHYNTVRAMCDRYDDETARWVSTSTEQYFSGRGVYVSDLVGWVVAAAGSDPDLDAVVRRIGLGPVYQLWITACALGRVFADEVAPRDGLRELQAALERPAAAHALATMTGGALHQVLWPDELAAVTPTLDAMVIEAVRRGALLRPQVGPAPVAAGR